ncbi:hypothetical protein LIA77_03014 [Sarocladium implicatum]|nr:hypothetical protein LIA77_03014 [Sarocladium implicatum]
MNSRVRAGKQKLVCFVWFPRVVEEKLIPMQPIPLGARMEGGGWEDAAVCWETGRDGWCKAGLLLVPVSLPCVRLLKSWLKRIDVHERNSWLAAVGVIQLVLWCLGNGRVLAESEKQA